MFGSNFSYKLDRLCSYIVQCRSSLSVPSEKKKKEKEKYFFFLQTRQFGFTWSGPRASRPNHGLGSSPQACCPNGGRKTVAANLQLTTWPCRKLRTAEDRKRGKFFLYYAILHQLWPFFIFFLKNEEFWLRAHFPQPWWHLTIWWQNTWQLNCHVSALDWFWEGKLRTCISSSANASPTPWRNGSIRSLSGEPNCVVSCSHRRRIATAV